MEQLNYNNVQKNVKQCVEVSTNILSARPSNVFSTKELIPRLLLKWLIKERSKQDKLTNENGDIYVKNRCNGNVVKLEWSIPWGVYISPLSGISQLTNDSKHRE